MTNFETQDEVLDRLRNYRPLLLACEAIGWLHMAGKARINELIFEVEKNSVEKYSGILADIMKNTVQLEDVKLNININIGKNWAETK